MNAVDIAMAAINTELTRLRESNSALSKSLEEARLRLIAIQQEHSLTKQNLAVSKGEVENYQRNLQGVKEEVHKSQSENGKLKKSLRQMKERLAQGGSFTKTASDLHEILNESLVHSPHPTTNGRCWCG